MNYMQEVKAFNDYLETHRLTTGQIALWYAIMDIFNRCFWPKYISISSDSLRKRTGLSPNGLKNAREALIEVGLIQAKTRNTKKVTYSINSIVENTKIMYTTISNNATTIAKVDTGNAIVISDNAIVNQDKADKISVRQFPKTYITKTYKTYSSKKDNFKNYSQREYDGNILELYYSN